ncbi:hypothetical protein AK88_05452 [Plasmodium fragile]|uniref:Schizont-infected cell agglutination extracellular alpha domain-containing protein n=1 Tax=Plasmodium fragile TaxID=5857 RepID=A0A0D9QD62_PLAFR|nr:uncharacterized protein AK88_05452 [Plasmodium fragile]KJP84919.1 hypothetical protein AK88_05452 [Plasmodium fragile]
MAQHKHWAHLIRDWAERRGIWNQEQLNTKLWDDIITVLEAFVKFLERFEQDGLMDTWATSCNDAAYSDRYIMRAHDKERTMCRLMMAALYFKNGWTGSTMHADNDWGPDNPLRQFVKCAIVSIYMYYLLEINCGDTTGVEYALHIMNEQEPTFAATDMVANVCYWQEYDRTQIGQKNVGGEIREWLKGNEYIAQQIQQIEQKAPCKRRKQPGATAKNSISGDNIKEEVLQQMTSLKQQVQDIKEGRKTLQAQPPVAAESSSTTSTSSSSSPSGTSESAPTKPSTAATVPATPPGEPTGKTDGKKHEYGTHTNTAAYESYGHYSYCRIWMPPQERNGYNTHTRGNKNNARGGTAQQTTSLTLSAGGANAYEWRSVRSVPFAECSVDECVAVMSLQR